MTWLLIILGVLLALVLAFYAGVFFGVADCKRRFSIPKGSSGVNADGTYLYN